MTLKQTLKKSKTYKLGIAQLHFGRKMTAMRNRILGPHGLSSIEWFVLGTVKEETPMGGIRVTDLATLFDVKTTYITATVHALRDKGYVTTRQDVNDARVRLIVTTPNGNALVDAIEERLRDETETLFQGTVTAEDLTAYVRVVEQLAAVQAV